MWHGGNNYGLTGAAVVTTNYANDVMLNSVGLENEPKYSHLGLLHKIVAGYSDAILILPSHFVWDLAKNHTLMETDLLYF